MEAKVIEMSINLGNGCGMTVYKVDYVAMKDGYHEFWRTFGVYERREVAEFVKRSIEDGGIGPMRMARLIQ